VAEPEPMTLSERRGYPVCPLRGCGARPQALPLGHTCPERRYWAGTVRPDAPFGCARDTLRVRKQGRDGLRLIQPRYLRATRRERSAMLTEAERVTHRHRKTLIRRLHGNLTREPRRKQRGRT
jgi:hypothetical protein